ncbi:glutaredoxin family protein [Candidatus Albibeggiatoa sp. nov. NOAA]|uniref:glutaredoxin family protein n=1 Tax=Candidatus Albibeggiatoa sp. nov. NOAA TaxID=3162724 RepID=UPI0032FBD020|nr:glutaredoxin family protein [Thiotrichaceae bacterium]
MADNTTLTLYTRQGCHLCEDMLKSLEKMQKIYGFSLNIVDIDTDEFLQRRYGEWVPVLMAGEQELFHYHLDEQVLRTYFKST